MRGDGSKVSSEREKLVRALEARKSDLLTYENNLGFFNVKSSACNSMLKEMERKIARLKEEIEEIKQKIRMVDNPEAAKPAAAEEPKAEAKEELKAEEKAED